MIVAYPDGVDTVNDLGSGSGGGGSGGGSGAIPVGAGVTLDSIGGNREVWLWPGDASDPARARWHDDTGPDGTPQWTWAGRPADAGFPASAMFNGKATNVTLGTDRVTLGVVGDGTLVFDGGGSLTIARGDSKAKVHVVLFVPGRPQK
jgi:hypothetical protein